MFLSLKRGGYIIIRFKFISFAIIIIFFLGAYNVFARDVEITVIDSDLGFPLEGALIRTADGKEYNCNNDGKAVIDVPDNRQIIIQAIYPGYERGRLVINTKDSSFIVPLRLSGIMESKELVIEASRPGENETKTGRSVAISGKDIAQTGEIGIIEDVMTSVKLLPGVGYTGFFNATPSIRGGEPGDMRASLDGFYVFNPYFWGGGYSIFDPRLVESAQLSHGVFSSRYGHSISGLLEITSKRPEPAETQLEIGINTSVTSAALSFPFAGRGGILFMGRITYYDPIIALTKQILKDIPEVEIVNSLITAPYVRTGTLIGNFRFTDELEIKATGFFGMDGVVLKYINDNKTKYYDSHSIMNVDYSSYNGFINTSLLWNPRNDMLLKTTAGAGYEKSHYDANMTDTILNKSFVKTSSNERYYDHISFLFKDTYDFDNELKAWQIDLTVNLQGRIDYDWEIGKGFLLAAGIQEMFMQITSGGEQIATTERSIRRFSEKEQDDIFNDIGVGNNPVLRKLLLDNNLIISTPIIYNPDAKNNLLTTSAYALAEYNTPNNKLKIELGLRMDHYYLLLGNNIHLQSAPAFNPRLNIDINILKGSGFFQLIDISAGTGLFSSMNNNIFAAEEKYNMNELKPNRSFTSIIGTKIEIKNGFVFNIEGYYKYIFDRMYIPVDFELIDEGFDVNPRPMFNGEGRAWGIDAMLQKMQSRYFDGWISYSFNWIKYRDPDAGNADMGFSGGTRGEDWYFPSYHRFHNLNLVLNVRPAPSINIYTRFGLASGTQLSKRTAEGPISYPVYVYKGKGSPDNKFMEMYYWPSVRDENNRTTLSLPLDIKVSFLGKNKNKKTRSEVYVAVENVLVLFYTSKGNTSFNRYTGQVDTGSASASFEVPIPIISFGFKMCY